MGVSVKVAVLLLVVVVVSLGCIVEGGPGRSEPVPYGVEELERTVYEHNGEKVSIRGTVVEGSDSGCDGYFLEGTNIRVDGEVDGLAGVEAALVGTLHVPVCRARCGCEPWLDVESWGEGDGGSGGGRGEGSLVVS